MEWVKGSTAQPGAKLKGTNSHGSKSWSTTCTVTDADPGRVFAFDVRSALVPVAHWRYDIAPTGVKDRKSANVEHTAAAQGEGRGVAALMLADLPTDGPRSGRR